MAQILDGRKTREASLEALKKGLLDAQKGLGCPVTLAIIQVGDRPDSTAFINAKKIFAKKVGAENKHIKLPENITEYALLKVVEECNMDDSIHGIIVQLPLPLHISATRIIDAISPEKDADGLVAKNVKGLLEGNKDAVIPATARGIKKLLSFYGISLSLKKVVVVGRSMLVGKPIIAMCLNENATVTVCHSKTVDLARETREADVLIVAAGKPGLIGKEHVKKDQIVVDVGISKSADNTLVGDVTENEVASIVAWLSPVPGGVGPMTVLSLFENLLDLATKKLERYHN